MNKALCTMMMMHVMNTTTAHRSSSVRHSSVKKTDNTEPKNSILYEVRRGKGGKTVLAIYKARNAAEKKATELGGHVVARFVTLTEYKATKSSAKK